MMKRGVIKVGGSILYSPDRFFRLQSLCEEFGAEQIFMVIGGGDIIEGVRTLHSLYPTLSCSPLHWHCIDLLDTTFDIASELAPWAGRIETFEFLTRVIEDETPGCWWVKVKSFYNSERLPMDPMSLSLNWETTTDSLGFLLAHTIRCELYTILKSCEVPLEPTLAEFHRLEKAGIIDPQLAKLASAPREFAIQMQKL